MVKKCLKTEYPDIPLVIILISTTLLNDFYRSFIRKNYEIAISQFDIISYMFSMMIKKEPVSKKSDGFSSFRTTFRR
jgi:hypothetical protein